MASFRQRNSKWQARALVWMRRSESPRGDVAADRGTVMYEIRVLEKHGGKSGDWNINS